MSQNEAQTTEPMKANQSTLKPNRFHEILHLLAKEIVRRLQKKAAQAKKP